MRFVKLFLLCAIIFTLIDGIMLFFLRHFFGKQVLSIQGSAIQMDPIAAALCYLSLVLGVTYFILVPRKSYREAFWMGLFVYSVYELTNKAILKKWNWTTVLVDTTWGGVLFALTTFLVYNIERRISK